MNLKVVPRMNNVLRLQTLLSRAVKALPKYNAQHEARSRGADCSWLFEAAPPKDFRLRETYCVMAQSGVDFHGRRMSITR